MSMEDMSFFRGLFTSEDEKNFQNYSLLLQVTKFLICHDAAVDSYVRERVAVLIEIPRDTVVFLVTLGEAVKAAAEIYKASDEMFMAEISDIVSWMRPNEGFPFLMVRDFLSTHARNLENGNHIHYTNFYAKVALLCREAALRKADDCILKIIKEANDLIVEHPFPSCYQLFSCYLAQELVDKHI